MKLGVRAHDLASNVTLQEFVSIIDSYGFNLVQLVFKKSFSDYSYDKDYVEKAASLFDQHKIKVARLGAYFNPVHSDKEVVRKGIENFKKNIDIAKYFGYPLVGSETGSYSDIPWVYHPKNRTEEGYQESKSIFRELTKYAKEKGVSLAIESAFGHVRYDAKRQARLLSELNSDNVYATIDLYNLLDVSNFEQRNEIFKDALMELGSKVKIIHLKDGYVKDGKLRQTSPGKGEFDYPFRRECVKKYAPDATRIFEGVKACDILSAKTLVEGLIPGLKDRNQVTKTN